MVFGERLIKQLHLAKLKRSNELKRINEFNNHRVLRTIEVTLLVCQSYIV